MNQLSNEFINITIVGCGEVGSLYAKIISDAGYYLQLYTPRPSEKILKFASDKKISLYTNIGNWLNNTDIVISSTPGSAALIVAKEIIPFLKKGALFSDFSSASSKDKYEASSFAEIRGISFVDVVIMGSVDLNQEKTPLLCAGDKAESIVMLMKKLGAPIQLLPNSKPGDAASLKLLRTVFMKGLSALTIECVLAAKFLGVKELLYDILSDLDNTPLDEFLDMLLRNHVMHACRQCHEIEDATKQLKSLGLPTQLLPSIKMLFEKTCKLTKEYPIKTKNPTTDEALGWLLESLDKRLV